MTIDRKETEITRVHTDKNLGTDMIEVEGIQGNTAGCGVTSLALYFELIF